MTSWLCFYLAADSKHDLKISLWYVIEYLCEKQTKIFLVLCCISSKHTSVYTTHNYIKCATKSTEFLQTKCLTVTLLHILDRLDGRTHKHLQLVNRSKGELHRVQRKERRPICLVKAIDGMRQYDGEGEEGEKKKWNRAVRAVHEPPVIQNLKQTSFEP